MSTSTIGVLETLDTGNQGAVTASIFLGSFKTVCFFIKALTGDVTGLVVTVQHSPDNTNWYTTVDKATLAININSMITQENMAANYARLIVVVASTGASTSEIHVTAK